MPAQITILGTCHDVQGLDKWKGRKIGEKDYQEILLGRLQDKDFLFEEATGLGPSIAERLAEKKLGIGHYFDIDPPLLRRSAHGIPNETGNCFPLDPFDDYTEFLCESFVETHEKREDLWVRYVQDQSFENALLVCGQMHLLSMAFRLRSAGYQVTAFLYMPWQQFCKRPHVEQK
jgi:hypothetical protein